MKMNIARARFLPLVVALVTILMLIATHNAAAANAAIMPVPPDQGGSLFGQSHSYDVLLRGNGSAVVNTRVNVTNSGEDAVKTLRYTSSVGNLKSVLAFQEVSCVHLPPIVLDNLLAPTTDSQSTNTSDDIGRHTSLPECYQINSYDLPVTSEPARGSVQPYYYPSASYVYKKVTARQDGNSFTLTLPQDIKQGKSATIVMVYNLDNFSHKKFGAYAYDFHTLKTEERISSASVAISADNGFFLQNAAKDSVDYKAETDIAVDAKLQAGEMLNSTNLQAVKGYVDSIGSNGSVFKQTSSLSAGETLGIKGRFASNKFLLNWQRTVLVWAIALIALGVASFLVVRRQRKYRLQKVDKSSDASVQELPHASTATAPDAEETSTFARAAMVTNVQWQAIPGYSAMASIVGYLQERRLRPMFFGWLCALLTIILLTVSTWALRLFSSLYTYNFIGYGSSTELLYSLIIIVTCVLGILLLCIGLPILYAPRLKVAIQIVAHIILFLVAAAILVFSYNYFSGDDEILYSSPCTSPNPSDCYIKPL